MFFSWHWSFQKPPSCWDCCCTNISFLLSTFHDSNFDYYLTSTGLWACWHSPCSSECSAVTTCWPCRTSYLCSDNFRQQEQKADPTETWTQSDTSKWKCLCRAGIRINPPPVPWSVCGKGWFANRLIKEWSEVWIRRYLLQVMWVRMNRLVGIRLVLPWDEHADQENLHHGFNAILVR